MIRMFVIALLALVTPAVLLAQQARIGIVDMERAIVQTVEGKKAEGTFTAKFEEYRKKIEGIQKQLETDQTKLRTQERVLNETVKAELSRNITKGQTDLTRLQEDAQKDLDTLRSELMRPIAEVAEAVLNAYAKENNYTVIIDTSNPQNGSVVFVNDKAEITDEIIKRIDAEMAKAPPKKP